MINIKMMNKKEGNITTYKFSDLIEEVVEFNSDNRYGLDDIVGVTIEKGLIPTIANLNQTALDKFYLVRPKTFVYNPRTHGVRLGMGYNETANTYITSWNNVAFKVRSKAENIVLSKYLWLYFCRPDWDRQTNFLAWGSSTIVFAWKDFLDIEVPLLPISEQRAIVADYEAVARRIAVAKRTIATLQATAQTLYRKMFVDGIDKENLPEGWRWGTLGEVCECFDSKRKPLASYDRCDMEKKYPYYGAACLMDYVDDYLFDGCYILMGEDGTVIKDDNTPILQYVTGKFWVNNHAHVLKGANGFDENLLYMVLCNTNIAQIVTGGVQAKINQANMMSIAVLIPNTMGLSAIKKQLAPLFQNIVLFEKEIEKLTEIQTIILSGMGR